MASSIKRLALAVLFAAGMSACIPESILISGPETRQVERTAQATPTLADTPTLPPTPTVGYMATAQVAQATADAAMRSMVQATAEQDIRLHEQAAFTAEAEARAFEMYAWTATAQSTSVPLTATAQAQNYAMAMARGTELSIMATQTAYYPTSIVGVQRAQVMAEFERPAELVRLALTSMTALSMLVISLSVGHYLTRKPLVVAAPPEVLAPHRVELRSESRIRFMEIPEELVTPEQLAEIAEGIAQGRPFSRAQLTGEGKPLSRDRYNALVEWLVEQELALWVDERLPTRGVLLTQGGRDFIYSYREAGCPTHSGTAD